MAGEWLKMECATPDKPEVLALTIRMGWDDPDLTVGKLFRLWRWFDQQTTDGNARGVTAALLDRQVGVTGFIEALAEVGWLSINADGISLNNFDRHNGKTAKDRALTAKRVASHRGNGQSNAPIVTAPLAREEKKREEKKEGERRATRIPPNFQPEPEPEAERGIDRAMELANFRDFWTAKPGKDGTKLDWQAIWRTWARKAHRKPADRISVTVPGSTERDPALVKLDEDAKRTTTIPANLRGHIADLTQQFKVKH